MNRRGLTTLLGVVVFLLPLANFSVAASSSTPLVISEVMTGGKYESDAEDGQIEFIEIHNQTADELDITGWKVQYFAAARLDVTDPTSTPTSDREIVLDGKIEGFGYVLLGHHGKIADADVYFGEGDTSTSGWLAKTGGHVRIINSTATEVIDRVGWGGSGTKQPETQPITAPDAGSSIQRLSDPNTSDLLVDTDDNSLDFVVLPEPTPIGGALITEAEEPPTDEEPGSPTDPESEEAQQYYGLVITELLPDPGSPKLDSADEFVELYNPQPFEVNLKDYVLYTGSTTSTYKYVLPDGTLQPGEYKAFYSSGSKLTLVNSTGYAWLTTPDGTLISETSWYAEIGTEKSWALIDDQWQVTNVLTPSAANVAAVGNGYGGVEEEDSVLAACPEGKYRNPSTNRCKNVEAEEASLVACKPGQQRNPETNRCRSVLAASKTLTPCKVGQERNPLTNRCRNIAGVGVELKDCQAGYQRNPETNRCRKAQATLAKTQVKPDSNSEFISGLNYGVLGLVSFAAVGYGGYEYRHDFLNTWQKLRKRFIKTG